MISVSLGGIFCVISYHKKRVKHDTSVVNPFILCAEVEGGVEWWDASLKRCAVYSRRGRKVRHSRSWKLTRACSFFLVFFFSMKKIACPWDRRVLWSIMPDSGAFGATCIYSG